MANTQKKKRMLIIIGATAVILIAAVGLIFYFIHRNVIPKVPLSEITSDSKIPNKKYSNLDLTQAVLNIPEVEKFYKLYLPQEDVITAEECGARCYELFDLVFDYLKEENADITFADLNGNPLPKGEAYKRYDINNKFFESSIDYIIDEESIYECRFAADGGFIIYDTQALVSLSEAETKEIIHLDRGEKLPDTKYQVDGTEYSPTQGLEFAEKVMSEKLSKFMAETIVSPTELIIRENTNSGDHIYTFQFEFVYDGAAYFHLALPQSLEGGINIPYGVIYITIVSPDKVGEIYNMMDCPKVNNDGEYEDKYIPLYAAADLVSEYLAPNFKQNISEVTIKYAIDSDNEKQYFKPYWCFIIDIDDPLSRDYCMSANAILVDMQTGEIIICVDIKDGEWILSKP